MSATDSLHLKKAADEGEGWIATLMSASWSGDLILSPSPTGWGGVVQTRPSPLEEISLNLTFSSSGESQLSLHHTRGGETLLNVSAGPEPEDRDFLRFEIALPRLHDGLRRSGLLDPSRLTVQIDRRGELKGKFANSPQGLSYFPVLRHFLESYTNPRILEWGAGRSTLMMAEWSPGSRILSVEHHPKWYRRCLGIVAIFPRVEVSHQLISLKPGVSGHYVTVPFHRSDSYEVIFIDGRLRCDCLAVARRVVSPDGVVLLHDAPRRNYAAGLKLFSSCEIVCGTAILRP